MDVWLISVTVSMNKSVSTADRLRTIKWCVIGRVVDGESLNVSFWAVQSII